MKEDKSNRRESNQSPIFRSSNEILKRNFLKYFFCKWQFSDLLFFSRCSDDEGCKFYKYKPSDPVNCILIRRTSADAVGTTYTAHRDNMIYKKGKLSKIVMLLSFPETIEKTIYLFIVKQNCIID